MLNNLYTKIKDLESIESKFNDTLSEDQMKIIDSALGSIEKEIAESRKSLSYKLKIQPSNDSIKRDIDSISYNILNIKHIRTKLGINKVKEA